MNEQGLCLVLRLVDETHSSMVREDENQIDDTRWRKLTCTLDALL